MAQKSESVLVKADEMRLEFIRILLKKGFTQEKAELCAEIFVNNSIDGVITHGVNRFARFILYITEGCIDVHAEPALIKNLGAIEQWDGNLGPGPLNAVFCTDRAIELASQLGIGCVALANTNHWMRGGSYGWQAARKGFGFIGWTNTLGNLPAWGATDSRIGNNPIVFAVPYKNEAIVLDMAMSQFSYGKMEIAKLKNEQLPFPGGYNTHGELTTDPSEILESWRTLPIGYWKGAGLGLLLDIFATILSGGLPTHEISKFKYEHRLSQVFIAFDLSKFNEHHTLHATVEQIINDFHQSERESDSISIRYPGERVLEQRVEHVQKGIPVEKSIWETILSL
jgi:3-dehydro-L-gulonate 2-dehydrogenase